MKNKLLLAVFLLVACPAWAEPAFTEENIVKALAGEAGGQSWSELMAHAHAIKNRGHLVGVYGISRATDKSTLEKARNAWNRALKEPDRLNGCDHWLSVYDLKHSRERLIAWRHKAIYKVLVGETWFYKLK